MRSPHPIDEVLGRFARGDLDTPGAVEVALHVDDCPACAARVAALDPLQAAFASVDDPVMPAGFTETVLQRHARPDQELRPEPFVALVLVATGAGVFLATGQPVAWAGEGAVLARALWTATSSLFALTGPSLALMAVMGLVLSTLAARSMDRRVRVLA